MSMYIGKQGDKTIFSINSVAGGDVNIHNVPNANSIFHSDMPHLFVKQRYKVNLSAADNGYYKGDLPGALSNLLANKANVVIPVVVFTSGGVEYYHQMTGIGKCQTYNWVESYAGIGYSFLFGGSVAFDLNLEWGYYQNTGGSISDSLGNYSTGGYTIYNVEAGDDFVAGAAAAGAQGLCIARTDNPSGRNPSRNFTPLSNPPYSNLLAYEKEDLCNPDYMYPMGPSAAVYNRVFVRPEGARNMTARGNYGTSNWSFTKITGVSNPGTWTSDVNEYRRASLERHRANGLINGVTAASYAVVPVRMEFLVLNVTWSNTGGYTAQNLFTGADIKISNADFTIKGENLRSTEYEMLAAVSTGTPSLSNTYFSSNVEASSPTALADGGGFRLYGTRSNGTAASWAASNVADSVGSSTPWNIGIYKFPANSSVQIDARTSTISLNGVNVWSPSAKPLQLFSGNKANNVIIGDNDYMRPIATGGTLQLGSANLGLTAGDTSVVLLSLEWMSNELCGPAGDPSIQALVTSGQTTYAGIGRRLTKMDYDRGDAVSHQILVLRPNIYVPILVTNAFSYAGSSAGRPKSRFQYYVRKNGSTGVLEFWACSRATKITLPWGFVVPNDPYIQFPKLRINAQRLT